MKKSLADVMSKLPCDSVRDVATDITRFATSSGADCLIGDAEAYVRVYAETAAWARSLADWQPLSSSARPLFGGTDWLAIGPAASMSRVAALPETRQIRSPEDVPAAPPETGREINLDSCVQFSASAFRDKLLNARAFQAQRKNLDALYPGLGGLVASTVSPDDAHKAATLNRANDNSSEAFLASFGPKIKQFCAKSGTQQ